MDTVNGTFTATGQSATLEARNFIVGIQGTFSANVDLEVQLVDGNWYKHATALAADSFTSVSLPAAMSIRLNCTSYTSGTVTYSADGRAY